MRSSTFINRTAEEFTVCVYAWQGTQPKLEDLTQEAFLQLFRKIHTFRGESSFSTWLHRLTVNVVLMRLRKKKHPEVSLDATTEPARKTGP